MDQHFPSEQAYRRFVVHPDDILAALEKAKRNGTYNWTGGIPDSLTVTRYLSGERRPSQKFVLWLLSLFPDLDADSFQRDEVTAFIAKHDHVVAARREWQPYIRYYAENRDVLKAVALAYHKDCNTSFLTERGQEIPLLTKPGWIRDFPLELNENTELPWLSFPSPYQKIVLPPLEGFRSGFTTVKGAYTYENKRGVNPEPQDNGEIFSAIEPILGKGGFVGFKYRLASYFDYIDQCEVLGVELAKAILTNENDSPNDKDAVVRKEQLPRRGEPQKGFDLSWRAAYPGVNALCILRDYEDDEHEKGDYFLLHRRDETQSQAQNTVHVVPAGGHQSLSAGSSEVEDTSLWRTLFREFAEELFNKEKVSRQAATWIQFNKHPDIIEMRRVFLHPDQVALRCHLLGFGLDPVTLKPEVLAVADVNWSRAKALKPGLELKFNWELRNARRKETRHSLVELSEDNLARHAEGMILKIEDRYLPSLPAGAACLMLAAEHFEDLGLC
ncbi:hypothetical protein LCL97_24185 [Seohaeicola saemankumensis]|nr:hypothetical protein [Seohaeicola saemankumensis]MCA0873936.1 hypothetical protein [Seohaeicola saemankumensis]